MTVGRSLRHAATRERLDINQWPDLDKIRFTFDLVGSGQSLMGPIMFGRAYDAPPFFTHSMVAKAFFQTGPRATIGVVNWVRDQQDMYVGCHLWIRLDSTSFGSPGLENSLALTGGGPLGDEIPELPSSGAEPVWKSDDTPAPKAQAWMQGVATDPFEWVISTANPRTGNYHLRAQHLDGSKTFFDSLLCYWIAGEVPDHPSPFWFGRQYSLLVLPGDIVIWGGHFMASDISQEEGAKPALLRLEMDIHKRDGTFLEKHISEDLQTRFGEIELTTSYARHVISAVVPPEGGYVVTWWKYEQGTLRPIYVDGDDFILGGGTGRYQVTINFEGLSLKGYGNIHKIEKQSAPILVTLA